MEDTLNQLFMVLAFGIRKLHSKKGYHQKSVCIARCDSIGDYVMFAASLEAYRHLFKDAYIVLLVSNVAKDLAIRCPYVDEVWSVHVRDFRVNPLVRIQWLVRMSRAGFDVAINTVYSTNFSYLECLVGWTFAKDRIAFEHGIGRRKRRRRWPFYTRLVSTSHEMTFEISRNGELLGSFGYHGVTRHRGRVWCTNQDVRSTMLHLAPLRGRKFLVLAPGTQKEFKRWSEDKFAETAREVAQHTGLSVVLCGSASETDLCARIASTLDHWHVPVLNLSGHTSLPELGVICSLSGLTIGNDSAILHIAAAAGVPMVCVLGGGQFGRFFPYPRYERMRVVTNALPCFNCDWNCSFTEMQCITGIRKEDVVCAAIELYDRMKMAASTE